MHYRTSNTHGIENSLIMDETIKLLAGHLRGAGDFESGSQVEAGVELRLMILLHFIISKFLPQNFTKIIKSKSLSKT